MSYPDTIVKNLPLHQNTESVVRVKGNIFIL